MDYVGKDPKTGNQYTVCDPGEDCKGSDKVRVFYNANNQIEADITDEQRKVIAEKIKSELRSKIDRTVDTDETGRIKALTKVKTDKPPNADKVSSDNEFRSSRITKGAIRDGYRGYGLYWMC